MQSRDFLNHFIVVSMLLNLSLSCHKEKVPRIFLIGDSTMADKPIQENPERGWGQMLPFFFQKGVVINNHAVNGRSTKSFIDENRWQTVLDSLRPGDYVFIQFGHNDQKEYDSTRYDAPHMAYKRNLEKFVLESREKKAVPILITPVMRRRFDENGHFFDTHGEYPDVVKAVANTHHVPMIDLHQKSKQLIVELGLEDSKKLFLWVEPKQYPRFPHGKEDNTHFSEYGAIQISSLVVEEIINLDLDIKKYINLNGFDNYSG